MIQNLEFHLKMTKYIYIKSRQSFEIYKTIGSQENLYDPLLIHLMYVTITDAIIGLEKLFSKKKSQEYRIRRLLKCLKEGGKPNCTKIEVECIEKWEKILVNSDEVLRLIENLRDRHFAHTDKDDSYKLDTNSIDYRGVLNNSEIDKLFEFVKEIIIKVYYDCGLGLTELDLFFSKQDIWDWLGDGNSG